MLKNEQMKSIVHEIDLIVQKFTPNIDRQVYCQYDVFSMFKSIENQMLMRDCVAVWDILSKQFYNRTIKRDKK